MYRGYWGMEFNPFDKEQKGSDFYQGVDFKETQKRLEHLKNIRGIGVFTGQAGEGKTSAIRYFMESLNKNLYQVIYIQMTTVSVSEFYRDLATSLGLEPKYRKLDNFKQIQERITTLFCDQRVTPVFWIDEAQYLNQHILADLKLLMNFEMDSRNYAILILSGLPAINSTLSMRMHEALHQRIVMNYCFQGLSEEEVKNYLETRLRLCGAKADAFTPTAIIAMSNYSNGAIRKLDNVVHKALMIGCSKEVKTMDNELILEAINESELL